MRALLLQDVTAGDLAMDSIDGEGYRVDDVIGPAGSTVRVVDTEPLGTSTWEVDGFKNDPFAAGFVPRAWLKVVDTWVDRSIPSSPREVSEAHMTADADHPAEPDSDNCAVCGLAVTSDGRHGFDTNGVLA